MMDELRALGAYLLIAIGLLFVAVQVAHLVDRGTARIEAPLAAVPDPARPPSEDLELKGNNDAD